MKEPVVLANGSTKVVVNSKGKVEEATKQILKISGVVQE